MLKNKKIIYSKTTQILINICFVEEEEKSSHYGLYLLGYTCATKLKTKRGESENLSKSLKIN